MLTFYTATPRRGEIIVCTAGVVVHDHFKSYFGLEGMRMAKVKMKVSGRVRTMAGAHDFAILRGSIDTARKRGWSGFDALNTPPEILIGRLRTG